MSSSTLRIRRPSAILFFLIGIILIEGCQSHGAPATPPGEVGEIAGECQSPPTDTADQPQLGRSAAAASAAERRLAMQLVAIFENGTTELQYAYTEHHDDGRGYTVGSVGFTTGTGDAVDVIREYADLVARTPGASQLSRQRSAALSAYVRELDRLDRLAEDDERRGDISRLVGFDAAWRAAAADPLFRAAQDTVSDELYYIPALRYAAELSLDTPLARAALLDAIIQHGGGEDPDGLPAMLGLTRKEKGTPGSVTQEIAWLRRFLEIRAADLNCAHSEDTRDVWRESVDRVSVYQKFLEAGNVNLTPPLSFDVFGDQWQINPK